MCGIAGIFNLNLQPISPVLITKMTQALIHRGPDGEGVWTEDNVGLGHRRLAILDLSNHGQQPMMCESKRFVLSYNGEIYNFRELKIELEALGHVFHSKTDTEVLLKAFSEWGRQTVLKFNGMFAFAIWDRQEKILHLARDRYGIKPLYYAIINQKLIFSSEIKAILQHPDCSAQVNQQALIEYLTFQNFMGDETLFHHINIIKPAHVYSISADKIDTWQYWDFDFKHPIQINPNDCAQELERLIIQAINRHLIADVELGAYLSGGMDSASITAIAAKQLPYLKTFTCGFDVSSASGIEQDFDERKDAEHMSYLFKTEHYEMVLKAGDMERCLRQLCYHIEEPRVGQSYPNYYIARLASKFGKVVLAGTGGDEIFAGYPWRYYPQLHSHNQEDFLKNYFHYWQRLFKTDEYTAVFQPIQNQLKHYPPFEKFSQIFPKQTTALSPADYLSQCLYFEAKTFLHGLLIIEDKLSMAHSLESRVPFLDNDLVDFAMRIPIEYKLDNIHQIYKQPTAASQYKEGKQIFRTAMKNHLPAFIIQKNKQGFSAPDASWFKGESIDYVKKLLLNPRAKIYNYLDQNYIHHKIHEHFNGQQNLRLLIWSLISLENCFNTFF